MKSFRFWLLSGLLFITLPAAAQRLREVQEQTHVWWSINSQARVSSKWSVAADVHIRRTDFLASNSFFFVRAAAVYHVTPNLAVSAGPGKLWLANRSGATELFSNENRLVEQAVLTQRLGRVQLLHRLRLEQRWQQKVVNFIPVDEIRYTNRYRYMLGVTIPLSTNRNVPALNFVDEVLLQSGRDIVYNTFDQNRLFAGIRQQVTPSLAFDFGYMLVYQQRLSGFQYSRNHTLRWFFFWQPDWRKKKPADLGVQLSE
ncbi:MAG TPA: DUF2490 domain-containing protein [Lacibacter sp.]|nr:DUF2490 domain-containing protein [Lacibacter sp.]HMO90206.1 DUF2490 domain-containing protein [Lacibacter sp.]HMP87818.1 DUF2490 domain-containing protein [Lacibacter sp.]